MSDLDYQDGSANYSTLFNTPVMAVAAVTATELVDEQLRNHSSAVSPVAGINLRPWCSAAGGR